MLDATETLALSNDGARIAEAAREIGVSRASLYRAMHRHGVQFEGGDMSDIRRRVQFMKPVDAVELLLGILEECIGEAQGVNGEIGRFPGDLLTRRQKQVFAAIYGFSPKVAPRSRIMWMIWGGDGFDNMPTSTALDMLVGQIRRRLQHLTGFEIETVTGEGFRLKRSPRYIFPWEREP